MTRSLIQFEFCEWFSSHRLFIGALVTDTVVMDVAAIGTPFLLLRFRARRFRAISRDINLSAPVRLLIAPLRPLILEVLPYKALSLKINLVVLAFASVSGVLVHLLLRLVSGTRWHLGVVSELSPYSIPAGLHVFSAAMISYYPLICRASARMTHLTIGRVTQTVVGVSFPLGGFLLAGLHGAVWLFAVGSLVSGIVWISLGWLLTRND